MIKAAYKSVSGLQGAGDGVRDVVAITGKAGNEDNAHAGVRKQRALFLQTSVQRRAGYECF